MQWVHDHTPERACVLAQVRNAKKIPLRPAERQGLCPAPCGTARAGEPVRRWHCSGTVVLMVQPS
eukprot:8568136-Karenia_brevis.AAC.1